MSRRRPVLIVEADPNDALFIRTAFEELGIQNPVASLSDGEMAIHYLLGAGKHGAPSDHRPPVLMILDLRMPKMSGIDVLRWLSDHPDAKAGLHVVVLTSLLPADAKLVRELGGRRSAGEATELPTA